MALRASYYGVKRDDAVKLKKIPGIVEIGDGLTLSDDGTLTGDAGTVVANPENEATGTLNKLQVGETIYTVPGNDNTKCYQTDDGTESNIVDADYVPFFDSSAASGAGAPRKSTWSNFCSKVAAKLNSVFFSRSEQAVLGAKNLLPNKAITSSNGGLDYTANSDKSITVGAGTATAESWGYFNASDYFLEAGTYVLTGCPSGGSQSTYELRLSLADSKGGGQSQLVEDTGNGATFTITSRNWFRVYCGIRVENGATLSSAKTFYPMIRLASDTDPTYAPYAMTNRELTEQFPTNYTSTGLTITNGTISEGGYYKVGNTVVVNIRLQATTSSTEVDIAGFPSYTGADKVICSAANFSDDISAYAYITSGGRLKIKASDVVESKNYVVSAVYLVV